MDRVIGTDGRNQLLESTTSETPATAAPGSLTQFRLPRHQTCIASILDIVAGACMICLCIADFALQANFKLPLLVCGILSGTFCLASGILGRVLCKRRERPRVTSLLVIAVIAVVSTIVLFGFTVMEIALIKVSSPGLINSHKGLIVNVGLATISAVGALCSVFLASLCARMISACCNNESFSCCGYICIPKDTMAYERVQFIRYGRPGGRSYTLTLTPDEFVLPYRSACFFPPAYDEIMPDAATPQPVISADSVCNNCRQAPSVSSPPSYRSLNHLAEEPSHDESRSSGDERAQLQPEVTSLSRASARPVRASVRSFTFSLRSLTRPFNFSQHSLRAATGQRSLCRTPLQGSQPDCAGRSKQQASSLESTV